MTSSKFIKLGPLAKDLTSKRFGRITAVGPVGRTKRRNVVWLCACTCGKVLRVKAGNLNNGHTQSCGCLSADLTSKRNRTHGMKGASEYNSYYSMKARCGNPNNTEYARYGGRGIKVCDPWLESFENFYADMGDKPGPEYSIDRRDNDGDYTPENCRWATPTEQANNTSRSRFITVRGVTKTLAQWARITGINYSTLYRRLVIARWPVEKALTRDATH